MTIIFVCDGCRDVLTPRRRGELHFLYRDLGAYGSVRTIYHPAHGGFCGPLMRDVTHVWAEEEHGRFQEQRRSQYEYFRQEQHRRQYEYFRQEQHRRQYEAAQAQQSIFGGGGKR